MIKKPLVVMENGFIVGYTAGFMEKIAKRGLYIKSYRQPSRVARPMIRLVVQAYYLDTKPPQD